MAEKNCENAEESKNGGILQKQTTLPFGQGQINQSYEDKKVSQQHMITTKLNDIRCNPSRPTSSQNDGECDKRNISSNKYPPKRKYKEGTYSSITSFSSPQKKFHKQETKDVKMKSRHDSSVPRTCSAITSFFSPQKKFLKQETKDVKMKSTHHSSVPRVMKKGGGNEKGDKKNNDITDPVIVSQEVQDITAATPDNDKEPLSVLGDLLGTKIPTHKDVQENIPLPDISSVHQLVALGVETTHLDMDCHIIQITCSTVNAERRDFDCYILPEKGIHPKATEVNGMTFKKGILKQSGEVVNNALRLSEGLVALIDYLQENTILISHNSKQFQARRLVLAVLRTNLMERFSEKVIGFSDSYTLFLELFPRCKKELDSYKLRHLIEHFSENFTRGAFQKPAIGHENMTKIKNLVHLLRFHNLLELGNIHTLYDHSITLEFFSNLHSFDKLVNNKYLSRHITKKMASSGLALEHLEIAHREAGLNGVFELLIPRITKTGSVLRKLWRYFNRDGDV